MAYVRRTGFSVEELMAMIKAPCDPVAAGALVRDLSRRLLGGTVFGAVFAGLSLIMGLVFLSIIEGGAEVTGDVPPAQFFALFLGVIILFVVVGAFVMVYNLRRYREMRELARALELEIIPREEYCDKTLLEVYYKFKAGKSQIVPEGPAGIA